MYHISFFYYSRYRSLAATNITDFIQYCTASHYSYQQSYPGVPIAAH